MKLCPFSSREEVIWAAGLFEGEGWISVQKFSPCMGIQMTEKETLERFAKAVGGGPIYYRKPKVYKYEIIHTRKEQWAWRVTGFENVQAVISYLWNWLGPRRRLRAKEVLVFAKLGKAKPGMPKGYKIREREHGEIQRFWRGCKCDLCREASRVYARRIKAKIPKINREYHKHPD